jgi:hypothetical protein
MKQHALGDLITIVSSTIVKLDGAANPGTIEKFALLGPVSRKLFNHCTHI